MQTSVVIDPDLNCVFLKRIGRFAAGELNQDILAAISRPEFERGMNFLTDHRLLDLSSAGYSQLAPHRGRWEEIANLAAPCKMAIVHSSKASFGIGRQAAAVFAVEGIERVPFDRLSRAIEFLGLPPNLTVPEEDQERPEAC